MATFVSHLLLLLLDQVVTSPAAIGLAPELSEPLCYDWREPSERTVSVLDGEVSWLSCPLFSHPFIYNTSSQSADNDLIWYHVPEGQDLEQTVVLSSHVIRDRDRLWFLPATAANAGLYICMFRNKSSCNKIAIRLKVLKPDSVVRDVECEPPVAAATSHVVIPLQEDKVLECPGLHEATKMADSEPTVKWLLVKFRSVTRGSLKYCVDYPYWNNNYELTRTTLYIHVMLYHYQGYYYCIAQYQRGNQTLKFTRRLDVMAVSPSAVPKEPSILRLSHDWAFPVRRNSEVHLVCRALFPYLGSWWKIWWTVDGKTLEELPDHHRFFLSNREVTTKDGDLTEESVLVIQNFQSRDLNREFNCSVKNPVGSDTRKVKLQEEVLLSSVGLSCGLGVTLVLMLLLFVVYHVFWLELLLIYRSWFGTDERHSDDKEYDVYISYARNSEDESFVLSTLCCVLENDFGYSVCIFDRDSLPGGTVTDDTLSFVARSRRLLVVIGPGYGSRGSQALLELKAGIDNMALGSHLRVILVQYQPIRSQVWVRELRRARVALTLVRWQGEKSKELTSRFWKQLRVELPVRRVSSKEEAVLMRLHSQNSTSSQTGLISDIIKDPNKVLNRAA